VSQERDQVFRPMAGQMLLPLLGAFEEFPFRIGDHGRVSTARASSLAFFAAAGGRGPGGACAISPRGRDRPGMFSKPPGAFSDIRAGTKGVLGARPVNASSLHLQFRSVPSPQVRYTAAPEQIARGLHFSPGSMQWLGPETRASAFDALLTICFSSEVLVTLRRRPGPVRGRFACCG